MFNLYTKPVIIRNTVSPYTLPAQTSMNVFYIWEGTKIGLVYLTDPGAQYIGQTITVISNSASYSIDTRLLGSSTGLGYTIYISGVANLAISNTSNVTIDKLSARKFTYLGTTAPNWIYGC
jgi:uncharacterized membrane protein